MEQDFHGDFQVNVIVLCSFWYGLKDLFTLQKLVDKICP